jgi:isoquinoline 1-oxidoreductase beta subunit
MKMRIARRQFLTVSAAAAGGMAMGITAPASAADAALELGIWVTIARDDTITIRIARSEMGQGTLTGLAQLVCDELDGNWAKVETEYVTPEANLASKRAWGPMSTGGSQGIRGSVVYVRKGGAAARAMLLQAAAAKWNVPVAECSTSASVITHKSGKTLRYGELADAAAKLPVPADVAVKDPKDWKIIGKGVKRLDTADKLNGKLKFAIDVALPSMLNATIMACPVPGGKLKSFDASKIKSMAGVRHVLAVGDDAVAVVADKFIQAKTALARLPVRWDEGDNARVNSADIAELLKTGLAATDGLGTGQKIGDFDAAYAGAAKKIEADYATPFLNHAALEPMNCTAKVTADAVEIWVGTQNGDAALAAASEASGLPLSAAKVHKHHLGGGFGRKGQQDVVRQAVLIAKQVPGVPVKLIWSREEDMRHGFNRPVSMARMRAGLDADGNLVALHARVAGQSIFAYLFPTAVKDGADPVTFQGWSKDELGYNAIPNLLIDYAMRNTHIPVGFWRGVNTNQNAVYMECFIDEVAHAAGQDPLEFRRKLLAKAPKQLAVLNAAAAQIGWDKPAAPGVFRGICQNVGFGSFTAAAAEVSVSKDGVLKIHRIAAATDPGYAVNPDQIRAQVEGSFAYGLSAGLYSEITIENGRIAESNFDSYPVLRMEDMPKVETVILPSGGFWGGVGEPTIAVATPAVLNAIFAATGKRVRSLPLRYADLSHA